MKEVSKSEFYAAIGNANVHVWVPDGFGCTYCEFKTPSGYLVGFSTDSISIDDSHDNYYTTTYYLIR